MSHFLRESLFFWLLAAAVNLSENSWLFIGGRLDGKRVVGSGLCAAGTGDDAHLCHGCWDFLCSLASLNFCPKLCILGLELGFILVTGVTAACGLAPALVLGAS